jgi:predicted PolB exonuclease-like 3'-5' exonuclease
MDGSEVAAAVAAGQLDAVRRYCETDVMNTYLLYQRFQLLRGVSSAGEYAKEISLAREAHRRHRRAALAGISRRLGQSVSA